MPNIELNADNIKKFAKRLQKNVVNHDIKLTLSQSQELLAKTLGATNFNELIKKFEPVGITIDNEAKENKQEEKIYDGFNPYTFFVDSFNKLLARKNSSISSCLIQHIEDFEYKIYLKSHFDYDYKINFNSICFNEMESEIVNSGFSREDAAEIKLILNCALLNDDNIYQDRYLKQIAPYESLLFAKNLWDFLNKENNVKKKSHIMKIDMKSNANSKILLIDNKYYQENNYYRVNLEFYNAVVFPEIKQPVEGINNLFYCSEKIKDYYSNLSQGINRGKVILWLYNNIEIDDDIIIKIIKND